MNKKRLLRKLFGFRALCLYLLVILIALFICLYTIRTLHLSTLELTADNIELDLSTFKDMSGQKFDENGFLINEAGEILVENGYNPLIKIGQNDNYVMYFDESTTIVYVYAIEAEAITSTFDADGKPHIDVTKCKRCYQTAKDVKNDDGKLVFNKNSANLVLYEANNDTGFRENVDFNTMTNSVRYKNTLTEEIESHYSYKLVDNGVQICYNVGNFSAGSNYFPERIYATMYKPDPRAYINKRTHEQDEEAYQKACENWVSYMAMLGVEDAMNADYADVQKALAVTFEERFRGNLQIYLNAPGSAEIERIKSSGGTKIPWSYSGMVHVYTEEAFLYLKGLIDDGTINGSYDVDNYYTDDAVKNLYWVINDLDETFFDNINEYTNNEDSPLTYNPFMLGSSYDFLSVNIFKIDTIINEERPYPSFKKQKLPKETMMDAYNMLYKEGPFYNPTYRLPYYNSDLDEYIIAGGFPMRDEDGNFVYDEDGYLKNQLYSLDLVAEDNDKFGYETESSLPIFNVVLQFSLDENGLNADILSNYLVDASNAKERKIVIQKGNTPEEDKTIADFNKFYIISDIDLLPYMCYFNHSTDASEEGYIIVPDGSGALINFMNGKWALGASAYNGTYYGNDHTFVSKTKLEEHPNLMLGMYGFVYTNPENPGGILAISENGGNQVSLYAYTTADQTQSYFKIAIFQDENIKIGSSNSTTMFYNWADRMTSVDLNFKYEFLHKDEADYVGVANKYRNYLINRDGLNENGDTTKDTVVDLSFLGSFEKYKLFLGFKYKSPDTLTTFNQAKDIIDELQNGISVNNETKKVKALNVSYVSWTNEEMEYSLGGKLSVSNKLGGKNGLIDFNDYLASKGINLYTETYVSSTKGYDKAFGNLKYSTRSIANEAAVEYAFDSATLLQNKKVASTNYLKPSLYEAIVDELAKKYEKLDLNKNSDNSGLYLVDLGNMSASDFKKGETSYGSESMMYQKAALAKLAENNKLKIKAPFDYAFKYCSFATDIPMTSTLYQIFDQVIPFYQLVISGLFDYTCESINGTSSKGTEWFYAKCIETGSNLSFEISATNPTVLLDTDYTYYYQAYYDNWKEKIVDYADKLDDLGIHKGRLVYHKILDKNIVEVKYQISTSEYIDLYVNTTGRNYTYGDIVIPAYGTYVVE